MMKTRISFVLFFLMLALPFSSDAQEYRTINNEAFDRGEKLGFRAYYRSWITGKMTAGYADLHVTEEDSLFYGRPTYHVVSEGKSAKFFDWFFKVRDRFESYFDEQAMFSYHFIRRTREGGYVKDDDVDFYPDSLFARSRKTTKEIPLYIQDFVSAVYYARTLDFSNAVEGKTFPIDFFLDDSVYVSMVKYLGVEEIKTRLGKFRAHKFAPMMATGKVFADEYPLFVWVSADKNKIPLKVEGKVVVGSVAAELIDFENLRNPFDARIKDD